MKIVLVVFPVINYLQLISALQCFTCSVTEKDANRSCIDDPAKAFGGAAITNCNKKYCTIVRQEYLEPRDKVASFGRNCEDKPTYMNQIVEDTTYRFYYVACQTDLCNGGNGKAGSGGNKGGALGDKSTIYCPGTDTSHSFRTAISYSLILVLLLLIHLIGC